MFGLLIIIAGVLTGFWSASLRSGLDEGYMEFLEDDPSFDANKFMEERETLGPYVHRSELPQPENREGTDNQWDDSSHGWNAAGALSWTGTAITLLGLFLLLPGKSSPAWKIAGAALPLVLIYIFLSVVISVNNDDIVREETSAYTDEDRIESIEEELVPIEFIAGVLPYAAAALLLSGIAISTPHFHRNRSRYLALAALGFLAVSVIMVCACAFLSGRALEALHESGGYSAGSVEDMETMALPSLLWQPFAAMSLVLLAISFVYSYYLSCRPVFTGQKGDIEESVHGADILGAALSILAVVALFLCIVSALGYLDHREHYRVTWSDGNYRPVETTEAMDFREHLWLHSAGLGMLHMIIFSLAVFVLMMEYAALPGPVRRSDRGRYLRKVLPIFTLHALVVGVACVHIFTERAFLGDLDHGVWGLAYLDLLAGPLLCLAFAGVVLYFAVIHDPFGLMDTHSCPKCTAPLVWVPSYGNYYCNSCVAYRKFRLIRRRRKEDEGGEEEGDEEESEESDEDDEGEREESDEGDGEESEESQEDDEGFREESDEDDGKEWKEEDDSDDEGWKEGRNDEGDSEGEESENETGDGEW